MVDTADLFGAVAKPQSGNGALANSFVIPPFTVLNAREGWWQERKRAWLALGIQSELGRGETIHTAGVSLAESQGRLDAFRASADGGSSRAEALTFGGASREDFAGQVMKERGGGTSIFDPVLCELAYRWFCPPGGVIIDPFAGGSVRGIVAGFLGFDYIGVDLRQEQIDANVQQGGAISTVRPPRWVVGDSTNIATRVLPGAKADFVFSCPPYGDLERYSDDPADLSTYDYPEFLAGYGDVIEGCAALLKQDRFAAFVVGDFRDKKGNYRSFPWHTVRAFQEVGLQLYNEAVLVTAVGSLPVRTGKQFTTSRKMGKSHQNLLVFVKGDPRKAAAACNGGADLDFIAATQGAAAPVSSRPDSGTYAAAPEILQAPTLPADVVLHADACMARWDAAQRVPEYLCTACGFRGQEWRRCPQGHNATPAPAPPASTQPPAAVLDAVPQIMHTDYDTWAAAQPAAITRAWPDQSTAVAVPMAPASPADIDLDGVF